MGRTVVDERSRQVEVHLLPQFSVTVDGRHLPLKPRSERMVTVLALGPGPLRRATVASRLWPDAPAERAMASLRTTLWNLPKDPPLVVQTGGPGIELAGGVRVDLWEAMREAHALLDDDPRCDPSEVSLDTLTVELLPDWDDDWLLVERERFRQLRLLGLEALCVIASDNGAYARAVEAGLAAVACEPLRERAHRLLMEAHLAAGNRHEAIRQFGFCAALLRDELGLDPSQEMVRLLDRAAGRAPSARRPCPRTPREPRAADQAGFRALAVDPARDIGDRRTDPSLVHAMD
jgi:DNA-binding SARP family transcriptional activator